MLTVNFLSHDFVLPRDSAALTRLGAAVPDLWSLVGRRPLPLVVQRRLDASPEPGATQLLLGIRSHLAADAAFHRHEVFRDRIGWLTPRLGPVWKGLRHPSFAAHVLVEMVLDTWIVHRQPRRLDGYYACFTADRIERASSLSADDPTMQREVASVIERFARVQFLRDYDTPEGTTDRFVRLLTHTPFATGTHPDVPALTHVVVEASAHFACGSAELLEDVRRASDAALERTQEPRARNL